MSYIIKKQLVKNSNIGNLLSGREHVSRYRFARSVQCIIKLYLLMNAFEGRYFETSPVYENECPHGNTCDWALSLALKQRLMTNGLFWRRLGSP